MSTYPLTTKENPRILETAKYFRIGGFLCLREWAMKTLLSYLLRMGRSIKTSIFPTSHRVTSRGMCTAAKRTRYSRHTPVGQIAISAMPCESSSVLKSWSLREIHLSKPVSRTLQGVVGKNTRSRMPGSVGCGTAQSANGGAR